jgi:toxin FitB
MTGTSSFERLVARHQRCGRPDQSAGRSFSEGLAVGQEEDTFHLSILTLAEYDKGIFNLPDNHPDRPRYIASRDALADRSGERVLPLHDQAGRRRGRISGEVKKDTGHPRPVIDTLLAATAIEHDLYLVTRNVKDTRQSGAEVFDPWNDDPARFPLSPRGRKTR